MEREVDVCIIGGGLAGIGAALAARAAGATVVVLEASDRAGGKVGTVDGLEQGPHSFNGRYDVFWRLIEALQLRDEVVPLPSTSRTRYLCRGGRLHALRPSPLTLLGTGAFTAAEKLKVLADLARRGPLIAQDSLHNFFAQRLGEPFAAGPLAAMVSGIWAGDPRELSTEACFPGLTEKALQERSILRALMKGPRAARAGLFTLRGGMGRLGQAAAAVLPIELNCGVRELARTADGWSVHARVTARCRAVVVATEAPVAGKLLWKTAPQLGATLGELRYVPLSVVHWSGPLAGFGDGFGYLTCPSEGRFALGTLFEKEGGYSTFVRGVGHSDEVLQRGLEGDVRALTGGQVERLLRVDRWEHAVFQPALATVSAQRALPRLADEARVFLAGSYLSAGAMKDALASGFSAGENAAKASTGQRTWSRSLS